MVDKIVQHLFLLGVLVAASLVAGNAAQATDGVVEMSFLCLFIAMLVAYILVMAFDIVWSTRPKIYRRIRFREYAQAQILANTTRRPVLVPFYRP